MLGTYVLSSGYYDAYYAKAQKVRTLVRQDYQKAFAACDAILTPTSPTVAFKFGEKANDPLSMYLSDVYTVSANLASIPGINVPCGFSSEGLPIGLQLVGNNWSEAVLLNLAHVYENEFPLGAKPKFFANLTAQVG
jgi:aspartyl-tRNA(Asn)/glutamyl-tRNA(Gln) amidotransferase subunit A